MPKYTLEVWESADSVYEGIAVDGVIKLFHYCCGLDYCPSSVEFGSIPQTAEEVKDWLGDDKLWAMVNDPAIVDLRLDIPETWPKEYQS